MKTMRQAVLASAAVAAAVAFAWAHPAIEGGIKHGFASVKGLYGSHIELVVDPRANEVRIYISEAQDEKKPDGKNHEWVIPMSVRKGKAGSDDVALLPMRDPGQGNEWFPVTPVETKGGYVYYRIEATAKLVLDGDAAKSQSVAFRAGKDARGTQCLVATIDLSKAQTIRFEEVKVTILDAAKAKPAVEKVCFTGGWGLGKLHKDLNKTDLSIKAFADSLAKSPESDKFRKPQAPVMEKAKGGR